MWLALLKYFNFIIIFEGTVFSFVNFNYLAQSLRVTLQSLEK